MSNASNGIVHVMDEVIVPPTITQVAASVAGISQAWWLPSAMPRRPPAMQWTRTR